MKRIPTKPPARRGTYSAPALEKGLDILELLAGGGQAMTTSQIAARLGRSKNEIFRMVFVLESRSYLLRDPASDTLRLSNRLFEMGLRTPRPRQLAEIAVPAMEQLSEDIGHPSHLVVINQGQTVVIAYATGNVEFGFTMRLGYGRPAIQSNSGQTIIAFQPAETQQRLLTECRPLLPTPPDDKKLAARLRRIQSDGYLVSPSHYVDGIIDICAPILDQGNRAIAAVVIPCMRSIGKAERHDVIATTLVTTCQRISQVLHQTSSARASPTQE